LISHSTRCREVAERLTDTGRTRLAPGRWVTSQVSNSPGLVVAKPNSRLSLPSATLCSPLIRSSQMTKWLSRAVAPAKAPCAASASRNSSAPARARAQVIGPFCSSYTQRVPCSMLAAM
jgi:hypothetical protein